MELDVRTVGGVLALDRRVEVRGRQLTVDSGGTHEVRALDDTAVAGLREAAARLLALPEVRVEAPADVADDGWTEVRLDVDGAVLTVRVPVASDAPDELWTLLGLVDQLAG